MNVLDDPHQWKCVVFLPFNFPCVFSGSSSFLPLTNYLKVQSTENECPADYFFGPKKKTFLWKEKMFLKKITGEAAWRTGDLQLIHRQRHAFSKTRGAESVLRFPQDKTTLNPTAAISNFYFLISHRAKVNIPCQKLHIKFISWALTVGQCIQSGI